MKMNKIKYALFIGASLFTVSCSQDLLDIPQKASTTADEFFAKEDAAQSLLISCYAEMTDRIAAAGFDGAWFGSPFLMIVNYSADDVFSAGKDITDHFDMRVFDEFRYDTQNSMLKVTYNRLYKVIFMCNQLKANIVGDTPAKKTAIAEARVMSAYCHMMAAIIFNNPPMVPEMTTDYVKNAESQEQILKWCIDECEAAMPDLNERNGSSDKEGCYRVTVGFAQFVAGKSAMFMGDWATAEKYLKPLCESPNYALIPNYRDLTHIEGDGSAEKIFECNIVENPDASNEMLRGGWMATNVISWRADDLPTIPNIMGVAGGWGGGAINDQFAEKMYAHEPNSQRRIATFLTPDEILYDETLCGWPSDDYTYQLASDKEKADTTIVKYKLGEDGISYVAEDKDKKDGTHVRDYSKPKTKEDKQKDPDRGINNPNGAYSRCEYMAVKKMTYPTEKSSRFDANLTNFTIARLGEAYLLYAEACLRNGHTAEGKTYLNKIQERAGAPVTDLTLETLMDEKQYELWFEGCRFFDLVRWNKQDGLDIKAKFDAVTDNMPFLYDLFFVPEGNDLYDAKYYHKEHKFVSKIHHPLAEGNVTNRFTVGKHEYFPFPEDALNLNPELVQHENW
ncbi:MAG: RagB/SusD family nutrient uptake outer membrane protein [Salinivirgaceae bacterium]|nr:RagB/SusD family nutrient uptake outer membrane protein [Salinivirgaceae bacterium]